MKLDRIAKGAAILAVAGVVAFGTATWAKKPPPGGGGGGGGTGCPKDILCIDLWAPVICADGITYSNSCYADRACAPGPCVPTDGGPVEL
jgi:hypothetical protein